MKYLELAEGSFTEEHYEKSLEENFPYVGYSVEENKVLYSEIIKDYVDLGLPSGTMWARCNVNAGDPYDMGDMFNMMHLPGISAVDVIPNGIEGEENGDMVYYFSNGKYRMPTVVDFNELLQYTYSILHFENENGESIEIRSNSEKDFYNNWRHDASFDKNNLNNYNLKYVKLISLRNGRHMILPITYYSMSKSYGVSFWSSTADEHGYVYRLNVDDGGTTYSINIGNAGPGGNSSDLYVRGIFVKRNKIDSSSYNKIDLGLRTDDGKIIYFADRNIGADSPEEFGNYYQWGTTEGIPVGTQNYPGLKYYIKYSHRGYMHSDSFLNNDAEDWYPIKYVGDVDQPMDFEVLEKKDDAAYIKLGGKWKTPDYNTLDLLTNSDLFDYEFVNLKDSPIESGEFAGLTEFDGIRIISKISGFEGRSIYLPAAGMATPVDRSNYNNTGKVDAINCIAQYWCNEYNWSDPKSAFCLTIQSEYVIGINEVGREFGLPIRPVWIE